MSVNRDQGRDLMRTRDVLSGGPRADDDNANKNWLGHHFGSGAAKIDELLLEGVTRERLEKEAGRGAIREHLYHLEKEHGLCAVQRADGRLVFEV
ncbi:MAG: hypothetical protein HY288_18050 [Planctomycetia bacterium]|nr:hypothetical protein [Planctomycetia bacterium]